MKPGIHIANLNTSSIRMPKHYWIFPGTVDYI